MSSRIETEDLVDEIDIIWLEEDVASLDYVRQTIDQLPTRAKQPPYHRPGRLVGYAILKKDAKCSAVTGRFGRRVFWLAPNDRDSEPDGVYQTGAPLESVDPRTVGPTRKGYKTETSEGGPPSPAMRELGITLPKN